MGGLGFRQLSPSAGERRLRERDLQLEGGGGSRTMLDVWRSIVGELVEHDALLVLGKGLGAFEITVRPLLLAALAFAARTPLAERIRRSRH